MNPSPGFLGSTWGAFQAGEQLAGVGPPAPAPMVSGTGAPPVLPGVFGAQGPLPAPPVAPPPPPPPPPINDPHANAEGTMSVMPAGAPNVSQSPTAPPPPTVAPPMPGNAYPLVSGGGGGMTKARELERRGPSLLAAQGVRNQASEDTIERVGDRNADMAQQEYSVALDQERQARAREAAAQQSVAERGEEMAQRQADFDNTVKQLGKMGTIDQGRWWASRTTPQKIAGLVELAVSGFRGAPSMIMKRIDDDVKAQEFGYYATRDTANAKQSAFAMAMQKYQNVDAARAVARAASVDVAQAQFAQVAAKWKGTESANRADMAHAALQDEKMMQIANGIQFIPSQMAGRRYIDPRTGLIYSEAEAKAMSAKVDERDFENRKQVAGIGGQLAVADVNNTTELQKAQIAQSGKVDDGARHIAGQLQTAGVPQARAAADAALSALNKSPGGSGEVLARKAIGVAGPFGSGEAIGNKVMGDEANAREQAYWAFANASMKAMMGNVTESEMTRAQRQLGSATDPESRRRAINATLETLAEVEKNAKAGESPAAQAKFDEQRVAAKGDKPAAPKSAGKGW